MYFDLKTRLCSGLCFNQQLVEEKGGQNERDKEKEKRTADLNKIGCLQIEDVEDLICFLDRSVRKILPEASSCPRIFSGILCFYYISSSSTDILPEIVQFGELMTRACLVFLSNRHRVGSASRQNARIDDTPPARHQRITKYRIC